ncbi:hypothetical protein Poli38472_003984 [Pythium oligandrum]|uniref:Uncharacterized protein n=1 Tax=Pythium oligandrum TaxID=41045 RepID=A0A8K1CMH9_PYTOL|nr:hypothetical protein Poli38472_003984 [Pythium oligandrum]|eukprot:TMW66219.1 hypothetical protein Poli38472_003984 [Pythium oligandrum]
MSDSESDLDSYSSEALGQDYDLNLLAMQMQRYQYKRLSITELWTIWSLLDSTCFDVNGHDNLVRYFGEFTVLFTNTCEKGVPPIIYAAKRGSVILLRLLLNYHADINAISKIRESAVMAACRKQHMRAIAFLLERGARLDLIDKSGFSALRWAVLHGNLRLVRLLLQYKVSVTQDGYTGNSAIEIAMAQSTKVHAKILFELQRKLVLERQELLQAVIAKKKQDEIEELARFRRKMKKKKLHIPDPTQDVSSTAVPPRRQHTRRIPTKKTPPDVRESHLPTHDTAFLARTDSLKSILAERVSPPAMKWVRVGRGAWQQEEIRPRRPSPPKDSDHHTNADAVVPFQCNSPVEIKELLRNESAWEAFQRESCHPQSRIHCADEALCVEEME